MGPSPSLCRLPFLSSLDGRAFGSTIHVVGTAPLRFGLHEPASFADEYGQLNVYGGVAARVYPYAGLFVAYEGGYDVRYHFAERDGQTTHEVLLPAGAFIAASVGHMY